MAVEFFHSPPLYLCVLLFVAAASKPARVLAGCDLLDNMFVLSRTASSARVSRLGLTFTHYSKIKQNLVQEAVRDGSKTNYRQMSSLDFLCVTPSSTAVRTSAFFKPFEK